jgi:site-specific DNA-methyltransferase (adenine-specific)
LLTSIKEKIKQSNIHSTVKPVKLMQYLVRLVTPKNGVCLDPFMGSGTTGVACKNLNRNFIGIELDEQYFEIAQQRINNSV